MQDTPPARRVESQVTQGRVQDDGRRALEVRLADMRRHLRGARGQQRHQRTYSELANYQLGKIPTSASPSWVRDSALVHVPYSHTAKKKRTPQSHSRFLESELGWRGACIEAAPRNFQKLSISRPLCDNIHAVVWDSAETVAFRECLGKLYGHSGLVSARTAKEW